MEAIGGFLTIALIATVYGAVSGSLPMALGGGLIFLGFSILTLAVGVKNGLDNINESIKKNR